MTIRPDANFCIAFGSSHYVSKEIYQLIDRAVAVSALRLADTAHQRSARAVDYADEDIIAKLTLKLSE
jgi:hypothetical protein